MSQKKNNQPYQPIRRPPSERDGIPSLMHMHSRDSKFKKQAVSAERNVPLMIHKSMDNAVNIKSQNTSTNLTVLPSGHNFLSTETTNDVNLSSIAHNHDKMMRAEELTLVHNYQTYTKADVSHPTAATSSNYASQHANLNMNNQTSLVFNGRGQHDLSSPDPGQGPSGNILIYSGESNPMKQM